MKKSLATIVLPAASVAGIVIYLLAIQNRLPEQVATHWGAGGVADGFTSRTALPYLFGGLALVVGGLMAAIATASDRSIVGSRMLRGTPLAMVWFLGALAVATAVAQIDTAGDIDLPNTALPFALGAGVVGFALGAWVAGRPESPPTTTSPAPEAATRWDVPEGQTAVWSGRTPNGSATIVLAAVLGAVGMVMGLLITWWLALVFFGGALLLIGSTTYRVTVGRNGIVVAGSLFGYPRVKVPLAEISSAEPGSIDAYSFGGWGIRLRLDGESAVVTKSGPALVVTRTDGAKLSVSLEEPDDAAAVMSSLLDSRA